MKIRVVSKLAALLAASAASCASADSFYWTGAISAEWFVAENWMNQTQGGIPDVPGPGDSVYLAYGNIQINGNASVADFYGNGTVTINGSLTSNAATNCSVVLNSGVIDIPVMNGVSFVHTGGDVLGRPELSNCVLTLNSPGYLDAIITGSCTAYGHVRSGQRLTPRAIGSSDVLLYFPSPLINSGTIVLEGDGSGEARLRCDYAITNEGAIEIPAQAGVLQASLENQALVNITGGAIFVTYGSVYRNLGSFNIAPSGGLQVFGSAQTFIQAAGTFSGANRATFSGMNVRYSGGSFFPESGDAAGPTLYNCILENQADGPVRFNAYGTTTMYGHIAAGQAVFSKNWNGEGSSYLYFPGPVTNDGLILVDSQFQSISATLRTDYTLTNNGVIQFSGQGTRVFIGSLVNSGLFTIDTPSTFGTYGAVYSNYGDLLLNEPLSISGSAQTFRQISGRVGNAHLLSMTGMSVNFEGGAFEAGPGQGPAPKLYDCIFSDQSSAPLNLDARGTTIFYGNIAPGQTIVCSEVPGGNNPYLYFPGPVSNAGEIIVTSDAERTATLRTDYTLTNTGTVRLEAGGGGSRTITGSLVNDGLYLIDAPTTFATYGAVYRNRGDMFISPAHSLSINGAAQTFVQEGGTLHNSSRISMNSMSFTYSGGNIGPESGMPSGPKLSDCSLTLSGTGPIDIECARTTTIYGQIAEGQTLRILNTDGTDSAYAYFPGPITNAGRISVSSRNGSAPAILRTDYTLTNTATGIVEFLPGSGGARTFLGSLVNHGHWSVQATTTAATYSSQLSNYGVFDVVDGTSFFIGAQAQTFTQAAPGIITGGRNIKGRSGASFQYLGGQVAGQGPELTDCAVNIASDATQPIDLLLHGTTTFYGSLLPGHKVASIAMPGAAAYLYFPSPITNQGEVTLSTLDPDQASRMRTDYSFINQGRLHLDPGSLVEGGTFIQQSSGTTNFVLRGIEPHEFGRIQVSGTAAIDGTVTNQVAPRIHGLRPGSLGCHRSTRRPHGNLRHRIARAWILLPLRTAARPPRLPPLRRRLQPRRRR